jgi:hypothetical protein
VFERFAFELEVRLAIGDNAEVAIASEGRFVGPGAQDCTATASLGPGVEFRRRAVVIRDSRWIDEGDGLDKARSRDFDWEDECPSSSKFWADFPFVGSPRSLHGSTEKRGGIKVEHIDLSAVDDVRDIGIIDDVTSDVTVERASVWRSKRQGIVVGLDFSVQGNSEDTCRKILEQEVGNAVPSTCAMTIRLDLTRINDPDVTIRGGRGSNGRVIQV